VEKKQFSIHLETKSSKKFTANRFYRKDLGIEFKSSMEANLYRFYTQFYKGIIIDYEPEIFYFPPKDYLESQTHFNKTDPTNILNIKCYVPDFRIALYGRTWYIEAKGKMDFASSEKIRLFKKYYKGINIYIIDWSDYNYIRNIYSHKIKGWE